MVNIRIVKNKDTGENINVYRVLLDFILFISQIRRANTIAVTTTT